MFGRSDRQKGGEARRGGGILSVIGADVVIAGDVTTSEELRIDGTIEGNVRCGALDQGEGGQIRGDVHADSARLAGAVTGKVTVRELVLEPTARLSGDVSYESLSIAAGARIDGRLSCRSEGKADGPSEKPATRKGRSAPAPQTALSELFPAAAE
jgi:cytoskeletal protein CcmA (bactofilin family)